VKARIVFALGYGLRFARQRGHVVDARPIATLPAAAFVPHRNEMPSPWPRLLVPVPHC